jgi:putative ABC transport system permease protein
MTGTFLALREIARAKVRFAVLTAAVLLLAFLILFLATISTGLVTAFTGALEHQSGPVVVYGAEARKNLAGSVVTPATVAAVGAVRGTARSGPLYEGAFTVEAGGEEVDANLFGYRLGGLGEPTRLARGRLPARDGEAVASSADASKGFGIGRRIALVPPEPATAPQRITIVGLAEQSQFSTEPTLFVSGATFVAARRFVNPDATTVLPSAALAAPAAGVSPAVLARRIDAAVPGVDALTRARAVRELPGVKPVQRSFLALVSLAAFVVIVVSGLFFAILTVQKAPSITLLRATGASDGYITRGFVVQVVAVLVGALAAAVALLAVMVTTVTMSIPLALERSALAWGVATVALSFVAALFPLRRALRTDPIEATTTGGLGT